MPNSMRIRTLSERTTTSETETQTSEFTDEMATNLVEMSRMQYSLTDMECQLFRDTSKSFANNLMELHNIKPFDAKSWIERPFSGRGMLCIPSTITETLLNGRYTLIEKRKKMKNPDKPSVALLIDTSWSMSKRLVNKSAILLGATFIEFFGQNFARDFTISTIGTSPYYQAQNIDYLDAKEMIITRSFNDLGTNFLPSFNYLESSGFYETKGTKYIFIITDGVPETWTSEGLHYSEGAPINGTLDINATQYDLKKIIEYIENRWERDDRIEYFWIQLGDEDYLNTFIKFAIRYGYTPPREQAIEKCGESEYEESLNFHSNLGSRIEREYQDWAKFLWERWILGNTFYTTPKELSNGSGFHKMIDYFLDKFRRRIKI